MRTFGAKSAECLLLRVDPGERDHQPDHQQKEQQLDPDRDADQPPSASRPRPATLAVGRARHQFRPAAVARDLSLSHPIEYVSLAKWN